ncbi:hypothetical protein MKW92_020974 [Papaver armeniacum]|nr:hypothetical protein MKW92_020974 [Papaver armeniacum]
MISESFQIKGCGHSYCSECMVRYVASKVQENVTSIGCPEMNCQGVLEPEFCKSILPPEVFDRWGKAQCEALILGDQNIYCPFKNCSAPLLDEGRGKIIRSECPHCNRLFCARCKVPWHQGIRCAAFQKLNVDERENEDIMLHKTAKRNNWKRCPWCKIYVARDTGCSTINCRFVHVIDLLSILYSLVNRLNIRLTIMLFFVLRFSLGVDLYSITKLDCHSKLFLCNKR